MILVLSGERHFVFAKQGSQSAWKRDQLAKEDEKGWAALEDQSND